MTQFNSLFRKFGLNRLDYRVPRQLGNDSRCAAALPVPVLSDVRLRLPCPGDGRAEHCQGLLDAATRNVYRHGRG
jgi:hypothetical protein